MFADIFSLIVETISMLYLMIILFRFVLQLARADFYNPISQFVVKATNPALIPLRRIVPGFGGIDVASLVLACLFQLVVFLITSLVLAGALPSPMVLMIATLVTVFGMLLKIYFFSLLVVIISSWIAPGSGHPILVLLNQTTAPLMKPFQKILPPMSGLDLSPILVFLTIQVLAVVLNHFGQSVGMGFSLL